ncbi:MAG: pseudouridine synthase [Candidatus Omnitrophota bacterium]
MRLQVALSHAGLASRRKSADLVRLGKVKVNGKVVLEPGFRCDPSKDIITCGRKKCIPEKPVYIMLNKPRGVLSTSRDSRGRKTVLDLISDGGNRLYHVGRLDKDSSGLLLLTNDGEVAYRLMHPKFEIKRVYQVAIRGSLKEEDRSRMAKGIILEGERTSPCEIKIIKGSMNKTIISVKLHEGKKRQIRNMFQKFGYNVLKLKRLRFGPLELKGLDAGEHRGLTVHETKNLKKALGLGACI